MQPNPSHDTSYPLQAIQDIRKMAATRSSSRPHRARPAPSTRSNIIPYPLTRDSRTWWWRVRDEVVYFTIVGLITYFLAWTAYAFWQTLVEGATLAAPSIFSPSDVLHYLALGAGAFFLLALALLPLIIISPSPK